MQTKEKYKIVIVNDTPTSMVCQRPFLEECEFKVCSVKTNKKGMEILNSKQPDLVLVDLDNVKACATELCDLIKSQDNIKDIPIICISDKKTSEETSECFEAGCCDYITTPFLKEEYIARIIYHIETSRKTRELNLAYKELNLFCSAVSHDLKGPANVLNMLTNQLKQELNQDNEEAIKIVGMITGKSSHLVKMIENLLEFSRMCNIKQNISQIELTPIILEIFAELKDLEKNRKIELICADLGSVYADEILIRIAIKNVLSNSIKFTKNKTKAVITVSKTKEHGYTVVSIEDNGVGFDMAYSKNLFQMFSRLHNEEDFEGSGVGLIIIERIMQRHGGKVELVGEVDKGAKMQLFFSNSENNHIQSI